MQVSKENKAYKPILYNRNKQNKHTYKNNPKEPDKPIKMRLNVRQLKLFNII
jgi:hypothetical protein